MPVATRKRPPLKRPSPDTDPRFRRVVADLRQKAARTRAHPPASKKAAEASAAAKGPPNEKAAGAKAKQVDKIEDAPTKDPQPQTFLELLRGEIQKVIPKTLGETEDFMKGGSSGQLKGSLKGNVEQQKQDAAGDVKSASKGTPDESGVPTKQATPIPPAAPTPSPQVNGPAAMPEPKPESEVSLQDSKKDADDQLKDADVTPDQLKKANDPRFSAVLSAKDTVGKQADVAPGKYRTGEKGALTAATGKAQADAVRGAAAMLGVRGGSNSAVLSKQAAAKAKEEADRKKVSDDIEGIYTRAKQSVEGILNNLDTEVGSIFDAGVDAAINTMTEYVEDKLSDYKLRRYFGSPIGLILWGKDKLKGLPDEVNVFYTTGRTLFTNLMDKVVVRVADVVETGLRKAKAEVAKGQADIARYVAGLPVNLKAVGEAAQKDVAGRFAELEKSIDDKKEQIAQALADKYKEAFDKANAALKTIQDENKGLLDVLAEKIGAVIKILTEFKDKLMGILRKGEDTIKLILRDPIQFLSNLLAAIKAGFNRFVGNILKHLAKGFMEWLFGSLAEAGIEIPSDLTLPSILKLVLGVLGITYDRMRAKAVKLIGERAVKVIEKAVEYVKALVTGGPAALWAKVKDDLANLKEMVIDAIQTWLIETLIKRAIAKLVTLFNPVGAIVQAVLLIFDVVTFLIEKASQIAALIEAIVDSVSDIAEGVIDNAAKSIELALARFIPVLIGLLAQIIGLGGISKKIKDFILKVQSAVDKAIDKAIAKVVDVVKKLFGKGGKDAHADDPEKQKKIAAGLARLDQEDSRRLKQGKLTKADAESVAQLVKRAHPVFKTMRVKDGGSKWIFAYSASDETDHDGPPKASGPEAAVADLQAAADAAAAAAKLSQQGRKAIDAGDAREQQRRAAAGRRQGAIVLPTKDPAKSGKGPGLDFALLTEAKESETTEDVLELGEVKGGSSPRVLKNRARKRKPVANRAIIDLPPGAGEAARQVAADPALAAKLAAPTGSPEAAQLRQNNVVIANAISSITQELQTNIDRMIERMKTAIAAGTLPASALSRVQAILAGNGGTIRFVIDIRKGATISETEWAAGLRLIHAAFDQLMANASDSQTKLRVITRETK